VEQARFTASPKVGWTIWLTGLPASGKTTIAYQLQQRLRQLHVPVVVLDSDELRPILSIVDSYDEETRTDFYVRLTHLTGVLVAQGATSSSPPQPTNVPIGTLHVHTCPILLKSG
jgi:adenylylsulfate kinase-like enzyme